MDRLAVWQMALPVDEEMAQSTSKVQREEQIKQVRDWTQAFCEDVVRVQYVSLPYSFMIHLLMILHQYQFFREAP